MKIAIFSGGAGTRFWPLSRVNSPKQFDRVFSGKSTFRLALERALACVKKGDVFVSTNIRYKKLISDQAQELPKKNFFWEPERRDVGPAVGLVTTILEKLDPREPMAIIWSDHLVKDKKGFAAMLKTAEKYILENPEKIVFLGVPARFPEVNLGWINVGRSLKDQLSARSPKGLPKSPKGLSERLPQSPKGLPQNPKGLPKSPKGRFYEFAGWHYRPSLELAKEYLESGKWFWNTGYFVTTPAFLMDKFRLFQPEMAVKIERIADAYGTKRFEKTLKKIYPTLDPIHFDNAVVEKIDKDEAAVLTGEFGWSDVGTLYALKEALVGSGETNLIKGKVFDLGSSDCLLYNSDGELLVTIGLKGFIVVRTPDATLVCPKDEVPTLKKVLKEMGKTALRKYL